jgi:uncharacterized protein (DUF697 family)
MTEQIAETKAKIEESLAQLETDLRSADTTTRMAFKAELDGLKSRFDDLQASVKKPRSPHEKAAQEIIRKYMLWSLGTGLIPLPVLDLAGVAAIQGKMLNDLGKLYGVGGFSERAVTNTLTAVVGSFAPGMLLTGVVGTLLKSIPVIGTWMGATALSVVAGTATYIVGQLAREHFEAGGTPQNFDVEAKRQRIKELGEQASKEAERLRTETTDSGKKKPVLAGATA